MLKDDWILVSHMLEMSQKALDLASGVNKATFDRDETLKLALTHLVQVIGEAASHVSEEFRSTHSQVPWFEVIGMRHRIVHDYMNVDEDVIWEVIRQDLPELANILRKVMPPE